MHLNQFRSRRTRGQKAKSNGDRWEMIVFNTAMRQGFRAVRIPNGCRSLGKNNFARVKTPYDFYLCEAGVGIIAFDTKTTIGKTFSYSQLTHHQVLELRHLELCLQRAGYLIHFQSTNQIIWFTASQLTSLVSGKSLKIEDGILLGKELDFDLRKIK